MIDVDGWKDWLSLLGESIPHVYNSNLTWSILYSKSDSFFFIIYLLVFNFSFNTCIQQLFIGGFFGKKCVIIRKLPTPEEVFTFFASLHWSVQFSPLFLSISWLTLNNLFYFRICIPHLFSHLFIGHCSKKVCDNNLSRERKLNRSFSILIFWVKMHEFKFLHFIFNYYIFLIK